MACRTIPSRKNRHLGLGFPPKCRDPWTEVAPSPPALPAASSSLTPDRGIWMPHCQTLTGQMPGRRAWSAMPDCLDMSFLGVRLVTLHLKLTLSALPDKLSLGYPPGSTINPGPGSPIISFMSPNLWQNYWRLLVIFILIGTLLQTQSGFEPQVGCCCRASRFSWRVPELWWCPIGLSHLQVPGLSHSLLLLNTVWGTSQSHGWACLGKLLIRHKATIFIV